MQYMCARLLEGDRIASRGHLSYTIKLMMCGEVGAASLGELLRGEIDDLRGPWVEDGDVLMALAAMNAVLDDGQRIDPDTAEHVFRAIDGLMAFPSSARSGWELVSANVRAINQADLVEEDENDAPMILRSASFAIHRQTVGIDATFTDGLDEEAEAEGEDRMNDGRWDFFLQEYRRSSLGIRGCCCVPPTPRLYCMEKKKSMVRAECRELMEALEVEHTKCASYAEGPQRTQALKRVAKLASRTTNHLEQSRLYSVQYKGRDLKDAANLYGGQAMLELGRYDDAYDQFLNSGGYYGSGREGGTPLNNDGACMLMGQAVCLYHIGKRDQALEKAEIVLTCQPRNIKCSRSDPQCDKHGYRPLNASEFNVDEWHLNASMLIASWEPANLTAKKKSGRPGKHNVFYVPGIGSGVHSLNGGGGGGGDGGGGGGDDGGGDGGAGLNEIQVQEVKSSQAIPVPHCMGRWSWKSVGEVGEHYDGVLLIERLHLAMFWVRESILVWDYVEKVVYHWFDGVDTDVRFASVETDCGVIVYFFGHVNGGPAAVLIERLDRGGRMAWTDMGTHLPQMLHEDEFLATRAAGGAGGAGGAVGGGGVVRLSSEHITDVRMLIYMALSGAVHHVL